jgi:thiosulfate/3-mercaptopyruvate sulfurtransferase
MKMKKLIPTRRLATLALLTIPSLALAADDKHQGSPLITHEKLQERLTDRKVRLLDARPRADYDRGHIPGAVWVDLKALQDLSQPATIKDESAWAKVLAPLGISDETQAVFVYDSARQHDAARVWWSLSYAGVPKVGLVDGGFAIWQRDKRPVSTDAPEVAARQFQPRFRDDLLASRADVEKAGRNGDVLILDARSPEQYRGEAQAKDSKGAGGHIPGAHNLDGYSLVDDDGRFADQDALRKKLGDAGFTADRPVIAYSNGGNRSSIVIFALEQIGATARHYVPGLADWSAAAQAPVVSGPAPGQLDGRK